MCFTVMHFIEISNSKVSPKSEILQKHKLINLYLKWVNFCVNFCVCEFLEFETNSCQIPIIQMPYDSKIISSICK